MGVAERPVGHSQFAPPPLTEEFTVLLDFDSDIENLLDGVLEAVEVVVDQSCEGQTEDRGPSVCYRSERQGLNSFYKT